MTEKSDVAARVAELERRLDDETARLKRLVELAALLNSTPNLDDLLGIILEAARELVHAEGSALLLLDEESDELVFEVATGEAAQTISKTRMPATAGIAGWTVQHRQPIVVDDPARDERFYTSVDQTTGQETRNILAVPLESKDVCIGVVEVLNKLDADGFDDRDVETAKALAGLAAVAIDNARLYASLSEAVVEARLNAQPLVLQDRA